MQKRGSGRREKSCITCRYRKYVVDEWECLNQDSEEYREEVDESYGKDCRFWKRRLYGT